jgi:hypothetical protein
MTPHVNRMTPPVNRMPQPLNEDGRHPKAPAILVQGRVRLVDYR